MDAHGYLLKCNSRTASPSYTPSLIGIERVNPNAPDAYFERIDITDRTITSIEATRWDDCVGRDMILGVKSRGVSYYIPFEELYAIAASNHDDDTIEMLEAFRRARRP